MLYTALVFSLSILMSITYTSSSVCTMVTLSTTILRNGELLLGYQFYRMTNVSNFIQCARNCFFRRRCQSFNYNANQEYCELNNAYFDPPNTNLSKDPSFVYSEIADWDDAIGFGPCSKRPCRICEACYPLKSSYTCVKEELTSCRDVKICTNAKSDGHYFIRPVMGTKPFVKIYCHQMLSKYPKDYVTLYKENYSKVPPIKRKSCTAVDWEKGSPGVIYYWKIRLDVTNLRVMTTDRTFTNVSCDPSHFGISDQFSNKDKPCTIDYNYGTTGYCLPPRCHPRRGKLQINLQGSGFIVQPSVTWIPRGNMPEILFFNRSITNEVIIAICGGTCGYCRPKKFLYLELKP